VPLGVDASTGVRVWSEGGDFPQLNSYEDFLSTVLLFYRAGHAFHKVPLE
jgi:hypothetical protein